MKKRTFKQILLIATFCIALVAVLIKIDWVIYALGIILKYLSPLFIGFCIAFVLNKPYMFFRRSYAKIFKKDMASKPAIAISLTLSYIIFLGVIALFFWLLIPSITESVTTIAVNYEQYWEQIQKILTNVGNFFHIEKPLPDIALEYLEKFLAPFPSRLPLHICSSASALPCICLRLETLCSDSQKDSATLILKRKVRTEFATQQTSARKLSEDLSRADL